MAVLFRNNAWASDNLWIDGSEEFINSITVLLNQIWYLEGKQELVLDFQTQSAKGIQQHNVTGDTQRSHIGQKFLKVLDNAGHPITIKPGKGFACSASGAGAYYPLAHTSWNDRGAVIPLLRGAIERSYYTVKTLAGQLAMPGPGLVNYAFSPQQIKKLSEKRLHKTGTRVSFPQRFLRLQTTKAPKRPSLINNAADAWEEALTTYLDNPQATGRPVIEDPQKFLVCRKLEPWLDRGTGVRAVVTCNLQSKETTCLLDGTRKQRPLALALVHELIHAYYSVTGTRLYNEATVEDEAITTGLPPEHFRPFTENRFRAVWAEERLDLRLFYGFTANACPYCGGLNQGDRRIPKKDRKKGGPKFEIVTKCRKCGEDILSPNQLKGPGGLLPATEL